MGRLLDAAVTTDPTAGVHRLPQPFRMIDKILSGVVDDAADKAVARERRRLARLGIVEGTKVYRPVAETVELEHAATCVCVARFEDDEAERAERATGDARTAREARATRETRRRVVAQPRRATRTGGARRTEVTASCCAIVSGPYPHTRTEKVPICR